jgi:cobalt-zinc-cadmium efflux system protein
MFTHFFALIISLGAVLCANMPPCHRRTYGFYRAEILAAFINSLFLFGVTGWILFEGVKRILHPAPVLSGEMFVVALAGLAVNIVSAIILQGAHKDDLNVRSAFLHMLADTVSSVVVVGGAVIIRFTNWTVVDPLLSIGIGLVIGSWGWGLFRDSANILLEAAPKGLTTDEVTAALKEAIPEITEVTDIHVWTITSQMHSMTAHVRFKEPRDPKNEESAVTRMKELVNERFDIEHTTIELDR